MAIGYGQHQAREDQYFLYMAVCIIFVALSVFPLYAHFDGAVKYLLLRVAGEITLGEVVSIESKKIPKKDKPRLLFKNSTAVDNLYHVDIRYSANNSPAQIRQLIVARLPGEMLRREPVELVYLSSRPNVFLPTNMLSAMRADVYVAGILALVFAAGCLGLVTAHWRWRKFQQVAAQYGESED